MQRRYPQGDRMTPPSTGYIRRVSRMTFRTHTGRIARPTVVATFAGLTEARRAIETLEHRIDGAHVSLLGARADAAADAPRTDASDIRATRRLARITVVGAVIGALVGAGVAAVVAAIVVAVTGAPAGATFAIAVIVGALLVAAMGPIITAERTLGYGPAWELTLADVADGPVRVGVRTHDDAERQWVETTLRAHHAIAVGAAEPPSEASPTTATSQPRCSEPGEAP